MPGDNPKVPHTNRGKTRVERDYIEKLLQRTTGRGYRPMQGVSFEGDPNLRQLKSSVLRKARNLAQSPTAKRLVHDIGMRGVRNPPSGKYKPGPSYRHFGGASTCALKAVSKVGVASVIPQAADAALGLVAKGVGDRMAGEAKLQQSLMRRTRQLQQKRKAK
jgi:hypothetical protein